MNSNPKLSLVIPMYNEENNANKVVLDLQKELEAEEINYELVLVDNGSKDRTGEILIGLTEHNPRIKVVKVSVNQGYGWGIISGLRWANGDYLGFMGGDGQIHPTDVTKVWRVSLTSGYPLCKVSRYKREDGPTRKLVSHIFNRLFVYTFKVKAGDINGTPKIMTRQCYQDLKLTSKDWFLDAEVMLKAQALGFSIGEVPVIFQPRQGGSSNVRLGTVWEFVRNMAAYRVRGIWNEGRDIMWREGDPA